MNIFFKLSAMILTCKLSSAYGQNKDKKKLLIKCVYNCEYKTDSTKTTKTIEKMILKIGENSSLFSSINAQRQDSLLSASIAESLQIIKSGSTTPFVFNPTGIPMSSLTSNFKQIIHKNPSIGEVIVYDRIGTTRYQYEELKSMKSWQIMPNTAMLFGYSCQLAIIKFGGRTWQAWFTREIPVSDGPYKFYGLPGLIVQICDTRNFYNFNLVQLIKPENTYLDYPNFQSKLTNKFDFISSKSLYNRTRTARLENEGAFSNLSPQAIQDLKDKEKKRLQSHNNPIELE